MKIFYGFNLGLLIIILFNVFSFPQDNSLKLTGKLPAYTKVAIPYSERYEEYHSSLLESAGNEIIKITLDSLTLINNSLFLYASFYNNSDSSIYILKQSECIDPFRFFIRNSDDEIIQQERPGFLCDVNPRHAPNKYDLIEIPVNGVYHYSKIKAYSFYFSNLPEDQYSVKLEYYYDKPDSIIVNGPDTDNNVEYYSDWIYAAQVTLRGEYTSQNSLSFRK